MSKVQIYNIALNILGISNPIENAQSDDNRVILLNNYYDLARDYVLKDFDWNFASTFKKLSLIENDNNTKYRYCYDYPNDCVSARDIFSPTNFIMEKFLVSNDEKSLKVIYTDIKDAVLRYTRRIDKEILYTPEFSMALAYYLASLTSCVLVGSVQKGEIAYEKYKNILKRAKLLNAQEGTDILYDDKTYLDSRN